MHNLSSGALAQQAKAMSDEEIQASQEKYLSTTIIQQFDKQIAGLKAQIDKIETAKSRIPTQLGNLTRKEMQDFGISFYLDGLY